MNNSVVIITGGSGGIGKALIKKYLQDGFFVISADLENTEDFNNKNFSFFQCNVESEKCISDLFEFILKKYSRIDYFYSNAGILSLGDENSSNYDWEKNWKLHLMSHVYISRKLLPIFRKQKFGYFLITASAAGLLTHIDSITYSVTKHSAIAFAEWIAINNREHDFHVSVICPQAVRTNMTKGREKDVAALDGMLEPDFLVEKIQEGINKKQFLILPHPEVQNYINNKTSNYDKWISGMARLKQKIEDNK
ncbi:SDR family oxidoreductase [Alphaproteobacteria bacterium]|nr:SDR family oxidoreductase [Alphaproteobacteria bacterium]